MPLQFRVLGGTTWCQSPNLVYLESNRRNYVWSEVFNSPIWDSFGVFFSL